MPVEPEDIEVDNPRMIRTRKYGARNRVPMYQLPDRPQDGAPRRPMAGDFSVNDPAFEARYGQYAGSDGSIDEEAMRQHRMEMLMPFLNPALLSPRLYAPAGPGDPSEIPAENMEGEELGALFDPTSMQRQRKRY